MTAKRAMGQCHGAARGCVADANGGGWHTADCPALYPLQPQPGDTKDALTRLVAHVRTADDDAGDVWLSEALDLISEAREEHRRTLASAVEAVHIGKDTLARLDALNTDHERVKDALRLCQAKMGEVRQAALREAREELASLSNAAAVEQLQSIRDASEEP